MEYTEVTEALDHSKWLLSGSKNTPKLSPIPRLNEVISKQNNKIKIAGKTFL